MEIFYTIIFFALFVATYELGQVSEILKESKKIIKKTVC